MQTLEKCLDKVRTELEKPDVAYNDKLGSHLAWTTSHMAGVVNALRQLEKHDRHMARTEDQRYRLVEAYIRQLDPIRRAQLRETLGELEQERSVLQ
jgi:hypothetical protein